MIVIVRGTLTEVALDIELKRRGIETFHRDWDNGEYRLGVEEKYRDKVRDWFAHDDNVLWFSRPQAETP